MCVVHRKYRFWIRLDQYTVFLIRALVVLFQKAKCLLLGDVRRWFDSGEDDGLIERELDVVYYVQTPPPPPPCDRLV